MKTSEILKIIRDSIPDEIYDELKAELVKKLPVRHMDVTPKQFLEMDDKEADRIFEERVSDEIEAHAPPGVSVKIKVDKGTAKKYARSRHHGEKRVLEETPTEVRDWFEANMANRLLQVGAKLVSVNWDDFNYAPSVTWEIRGEEYTASFYLSGAYLDSKQLNVKREDFHKHTIETIAINSERFAYNG